MVHTDTASRRVKEADIHPRIAKRLSDVERARKLGELTTRARAIESRLAYLCKRMGTQTLMRNLYAMAGIVSHLNSPDLAPRDIEGIDRILDRIEADYRSTVCRLGSGRP